MVLLMRTDRKKKKDICVPANSQGEDIGLGISIDLKIVARPCIVLLRGAFALCLMGKNRYLTRTPDREQCRHASHGKISWP